MIKVDVVRAGGSVQLIFEARNTTPVFLDDLDSIHEALRAGKITSSNFLTSSKLSVDFEIPQ